MILRFGHHQECQISFKDNVKQLFMVSSRHRGEVPSDRATTPYNYFFPKTIAEWNQLEFTDKNLKNFKNQLAQLH